MKEILMCGDTVGLCSCVRIRRCFIYKLQFIVVVLHIQRVYAKYTCIYRCIYVCVCVCVRSRPGLSICGVFAAFEYVLQRFLLINGCTVAVNAH